MPLGVIRTRNPSMQGATDLRSHDQWNLHASLLVVINFLKGGVIKIILSTNISKGFLL
jgi:hypothetical protein